MLDKLDSYLDKISQKQEQTMTPRTAVLDSLDMMRIVAVDVLNGAVFDSYTNAHFVLDNFLTLSRLRNKVRVKATTTDIALCVRLGGWITLRSQG